jgi:1,4-dihydroxy-6-naphthoate synthase
VALTLGISPCPNDAFVAHAWAHRLLPDAPDVQVVMADVDVLNQRAARAELDVVKVSYGALPWLLDDYALLPSGGAVGRGCGPLVLTRSPATELAGARVAVPGLRTTAYLLMRLWRSDLGEVVVLPYDAIMPAVVAGEVDAGLVIHESRFTYPDHGLHAAADLGEWWERTTGLPIPLGAILGRRSLGEDLLGQVSATLRSSVEHAWAHPDDSAAWVAQHSQELAPEVVQAHIDLYVTEFTRDLGEAGLAAVRALLSRAADAGLVPAVSV